MSDPSPSFPTSGWLSLIVRLFDLLGRQLATLWRPIHLALLVLKPARVSLLMVLAGLLFLFLSDQGLDTLRDFGERKAGARHDWSQTVAFWAGGFLWTYGSWYWARIMYYIRLGDELPDSRFIRHAQLWMPRVIGAAAIFGLAIAFHMAAAPYPDTPESPGRILERYMIYSLVGGFVFLGFVITRRALSVKIAPLLPQVPGGGAMAASLQKVKPTEAVSVEFGKREAREVLFESRYQLGLTMLAAVVLFVVFAISPEWYAPRFGTMPILMFAAAGWIAFGSAADLYAMINRFPVWVTLLIAAVAFSFVNDNHAVRIVEGAIPQKWEERSTVEDALKQWKDRQLRGAAVRPEDRFPLFLVAAEGGGIRAAYWTASVLAEIQDRNPCFADQLFALSGVSGGSLGAAVFVSLLADTRYPANGFRCGAKDGPRIKDTAQDILGEDFLAPVVAATLYPDLVQRILPWPVLPHFDRARALEAAWERAWARHAKGNVQRFAQPFDQSWQGKSEHWMPALLLNATLVETGKRLIVSNLRLTADEFNDVEDAHRFYDEHALPFSTAVHLSARFTYVSPAGTLKKDGKVYGRAVDGGYFENSGTSAALEILQMVNRMKGSCDEQGLCFWDKVEPILILVSNEPADPRYVGAALGTSPSERNNTGRPSSCCNEVWSPLRTLFATREARGIYAREAARWYVGKTHFLHFGLCKRAAAQIPLGWTLSEMVRSEMDKQLTLERCAAANASDPPIFDNPGNLERIGAVLEPIVRKQR
jgi:hypothetical protein